MKTLMLGNEAVARGLYEAGCSFVSSYPGTPSTEITEAAAKYPEIYAEWAPNEKVAMEAAFGASLAGRRSFCGMKHVGLNVAADPLFTISYTGVNGGMIIGVADDAGMHSSQNEQDSRHYAKAAKLPMLEPADSGEALEFTRLAYELSETFDTPVIMKMCTRISHSQSVVETGDREEPAPKPYEKNGAKYIMMPGNAKRRHPVVEERLRKIAEWAEYASVNRIEAGQDYKMGIITSSTSYQYVKEACGNTYPVLKLGMIWPLPEKKIRDFAKSVSVLVVVEELDGFIEDHCRNLGLACAGKASFPALDELSQNLVSAQLMKEAPASAGTGLEENIPPPSPGDVRRVPPPGTVLYPEEEQPHRHGGHRLLHLRRGSAPGRHGHHHLHGRVHLLHPRLQQGGWRGERGQDRGRHRRLHFHALRRDGAHQHGLQRVQLHGHHPGQLHHRHDRPPAEPHHRLQPQGGPLHQD